MYQESADTYFKNKNSKFHDNYQIMICWFWEHNLLQYTQKKIDRNLLALQIDTYPCIKENLIENLSCWYMSMYQGNFPHIRDLYQSFVSDEGNQEKCVYQKMLDTVYTLIMYQHLVFQSNFDTEQPVYR